MAIHLTKRVIDAAKPGPRWLTIFDDALRGFALRVEPSGIKSFIVRYRGEHFLGEFGKRGHVAPAMTLGARIAAELYRGKKTSRLAASLIDCQRAIAADRDKALGCAPAAAVSAVAAPSRDSSSIVRKRSRRFSRNADIPCAGLVPGCTMPSRAPSLNTLPMNSRHRFAVGGFSAPTRRWSSWTSAVVRASSFDEPIAGRT
jgi:hypothetical protein